MRPWVPWLLPCLVLFVAPAHADPEEASALYASGAAHYERGEYDAAIRDFGRAYELSHAPDLLFNLAQAHRLKGSSCTSARDYYRRYLEEVPRAADRAEVEARISEMDRCVQQESAANDSMTAIRAPDAERRDDLSTPSGGKTSFWPWVLVGVGGALLVGGTWMALSVDREYDELAGSCAMACDRGSVDALETRGSVSIGLLVGGGVAVASGAAMLLFGARF